MATPDAGIAAVAAARIVAETAWAEYARAGKSHRLARSLRRSDDEIARAAHIEAYAFLAARAADERVSVALDTLDDTAARNMSATA